MMAAPALIVAAPAPIVAAPAPIAADLMVARALIVIAVALMAAPVLKPVLIAGGRQAVMKNAADQMDVQMAAIMAAKTAAVDLTDVPKFAVDLMDVPKDAVDLMAALTDLAAVTTENGIHE